MVIDVGAGPDNMLIYGRAQKRLQAARRVGLGKDMIVVAHKNVKRV